MMAQMDNDLPPFSSLLFTVAITGQDSQLGCLLKAGGGCIVRDSAVWLSPTARCCQISMSCANCWYSTSLTSPHKGIQFVSFTVLTSV